MSAPPAETPAHPPRETEARPVSSVIDVFRVFWSLKLTIAKNHLKKIKKHYYIHIAAGGVALAMVLFGLLGGFSITFWWLLSPERAIFGEPMLKRLIGMVMLAFFSMLTFSNLIIMLTTSYISREVEYFMAQPIGHRLLYFCKFGESTLYSSWAFLILSAPFFLSLAAAAEPLRSLAGIEGARSISSSFELNLFIPRAHWSYYAIVPALMLPFIMIPAGLGAIIAILVTTYFPAKRMIRLAVVLAIVGVLAALVSSQFAGAGLQTGVGDEQASRAEMARVMAFMGVGDVVWFPSTWFGRGVKAALLRDWPEVRFWGALLYAGAFMTLQVCQWLAGPLYYRGFVSSRNSGTNQRRRAGGLYKLFDTLLAPLPSQTRALMVKDLTVFWRDPAQWGQLMILFGLLFLYIANLGSASELTKYRINIPLFKSLITLFNIGSTCFILAILTTRFIYPMLSLEGKQQWAIGLAPLPRTALVWVKYLLCWVSSMAITVPLICFSSFMLRADLFVATLSIGTIIVMSMGLNSLAIGLGALMPNFQEDNPARIANGLGGTVNIMASMLYVALTVLFEFPLIAARQTWGQTGVGVSPALLIVAPICLIALQAVVIPLPLYLGLKHWKKLEF